MKKKLFLLPLAAILVTGCEQDEDFPKAVSPRGPTSSTSTNNAVALASANWSFAVGDVGNQSNPNNYQHTLVTNSTLPLNNTGLGGVSSRTSSYTLGMAAATIKDTASYCYWLAGIPSSTSLRMGASLTLKAKVRLDNVRGKGVSLVLRGDRGTQTAVLFATTQGKISLTGTADGTEYSVTLPYSTPVDRFIAYFVLLSNTSGSATFSDVSLQIN